MSNSQPEAGYLRSGLPYNRLGTGPRPLVMFQGLFFENKPLGRLAARFMFGFYRALAREFTVYIVTRRRGLPRGTTLRDMANDYATMIHQEFGGPVDVIGTSTGGSIALQFAADHPELVRKLVIHSAAYTLGPNGKRLQLQAAERAARGDWASASSLLMEWILPRRGLKRLLVLPFARLAARAMAWSAPSEASDFLVTVQAEDAFDFKDRLREISAPTLVIAGAEDPGYSPELFRETAAGIPNARLVLYEGRGHAPSGRRFRRELRAFLLEGSAALSPRVSTGRTVRLPVLTEQRP